MKTNLLRLLSIIALVWTMGLNLPTASAQSLYFPPLIGNTWDTLSVESVGWQRSRLDSLYRYLDGVNSKAFIVLKDGKIVLEKYFDSFVRDSVWYWASAGKSLTATLVGIAQQEGLLNINQRSNFYMGDGWTSMTLARENAITVRHHLTMTTGLDDDFADRDCWTKDCLVYKADPGTRWAYHNGPYTLLDSVIEKASGVSLNSFFLTRIASPTGMTGAYVRSGSYNNVMFSKPRSFARFGLLILNKGVWNGTPILSDTSYYRQMTTRSQELNKAYGYLWWLNGSASYMIPQFQLVFPGPYAPNAPSDLFAAIGKNGQICAVVPSQKLVVIRMGDSPGSSVLVPFQLVDEIWQLLNYVMATTSAEADRLHFAETMFYPNPFASELKVRRPEGAPVAQFLLYSAEGRLVVSGTTEAALSTGHLPAGLYLAVVQTAAGVVTRTVVKR